MLLALVLAATPAGAPSVTLVTHGPAADDVRRQLASLELPVELRDVDAPRTATADAPTGDTPARLAAARKAYVAADFTTCLRELEPGHLVPDALARLDRTTAARVLTWRAACHVGSNQPELATRAAEALAAAALPLPDDVTRTSPEVEALLAHAQHTVAALPVSALAVTASAPGASVAVDGRPEVCNAPCRVELPPGSHLVAVSADGYAPASRVVTLSPDGGAVDVALTAAEPELAARQWVTRTAHGEAVDSPRSLWLLSGALRAPRLLLVTTSPEQPGVLRGALAVDGTVAARAEREGDAEGLVKDLLVRGRVVEEAPPLYKRWPFWVAVGAAVAAGVTTAVVVANQNVVTRVELNP